MMIQDKYKASVHTAAPETGNFHSDNGYILVYASNDDKEKVFAAIRGMWPVTLPMKWKIAQPRTAYRGRGYGRGYSNSRGRGRK
jgi:hypothetical protein